MTHEREIIHTHIYVIYVSERKTTERKNELENNIECHYITLHHNSQNVALINSNQMIYRSYFLCLIQKIFMMDYFQKRFYFSRLNTKITRYFLLIMYIFVNEN